MNGNSIKKQSITNGDIVKITTIFSSNNTLYVTVYNMTTHKDIKESYYFSRFELITDRDELDEIMVELL